MNDKEFFEKMGLDGDTFKNVFNTIKTRPPIHIVNLDDITDHMYVGKYLLSLETAFALGMLTVFLFLLYSQFSSINSLPA